MDENTWRFAQLMMWFMGLQTVVIMAALGFMWSHLNKKFDLIDQKFDKLHLRLEKIEEKITDIDKRVFAIETMLHMKDCCMLKDERQLKRAE